MKKPHSVIIIKGVFFNMKIKLVNFRNLSRSRSWKQLPTSYLKKKERKKSMIFGLGSGKFLNI
jgi:hypothetical protein